MAHDLKFLHTFHTVCAEGGFGRAAARLNYTQPAVTYQIRALEREVGAPLFERSGRRATLTPAGRRLLAFCRRFFAEYTEIRTSLTSGDLVRAEPLRIASVSGFGRYVLFPALAALLERRARTFQLDLRFRTAHEVLRQVEEAEVDFGVVYLTKVSNQLSFQHLVDEELALIAAPALVRDDFRSRDLTRLREYETIPFVTYLESDYVFGRWFDTSFGDQPASTTSVHHFDELEEVIEMVAQGHGASIVPLDSALQAVRRRRVQMLRPIRGRRCVNRIYGVTRPAAFLREELDELRNMIAQGTAALRRRPARAAPRRREHLTPTS